MDAATTTADARDPEWVPTPIWPESYQVTEAGEVQSVAREVIDSKGRTRRYKGRRLRSWINNLGYPCVGLSGGGGGKRRIVTVHALVKNAFHGPTPPGMEILHVDGNPANCHLSNLEFGTSADNKADIARHGRNYWANRDRCDWGHLLTGGNLSVSPNEPGRRRCVACIRARSAAATLRSKGEPVDFRAIADQKYLELTGLVPEPYVRARSTRLDPKPPRVGDPIPDLPGELWKPIPGWDDSHAVSNLGRVKSLDRWRKRRDGQWRHYRGKLFVPTPGRSGYLIVGLPDHTTARLSRTYQVHLLVTLAFLGPTPPGCEVLHGDGDPGNARLDNLRFGTHAENQQEMVRHGRGPDARQGDECRFGHRLEAPNLVESKLPARKCLACTRAQVQESTARRRSGHRKGSAEPHQVRADRKYREIMGTETADDLARKERTACGRGHELIPSNLVQSKLPSRCCLACCRALSTARYERSQGRDVDLQALADEYFANIVAT